MCQSAFAREAYVCARARACLCGWAGFQPEPTTAHSLQECVPDTAELRSLKALLTSKQHKLVHAFPPCSNTWQPCPGGAAVTCVCWPCFPAATGSHALWRDPCGQEDWGARRHCQGLGQLEWARGVCMDREGVPGLWGGRDSQHRDFGTHHGKAYVDRGCASAQVSARTGARYAWVRDAQSGAVPARTASKGMQGWERASTRQEMI